MAACLYVSLLVFVGPAAWDGVGPHPDDVAFDGNTIGDDVGAASPAARPYVQTLRQAAYGGRPAPPPVTPPPATAASVTGKRPDVARGESAAATSRGPSLTATWRLDRPPRVNESAVSHLVVRNDGPGDAQDVRVEVAMPLHVRVLDARPRPQGDRLSWSLGRLGGGRSVEIPLLMRVASADAVRPAVRISHAREFRVQWPSAARPPGETPPASPADDAEQPFAPADQQ